MGGVLICIAILLPTLLWSDLSNPFVWLVMCSTMAFAAIGFADDYIKVVQRRNLGLTPTQKLGLQIISGVAIALVLLAMRRCKQLLHSPDGAVLQALSSRFIHPYAGRDSASWVCSPFFPS